MQKYTPMIIKRENEEDDSSETKRQRLNHKMTIPPRIFDLIFEFFGSPVTQFKLLRAYPDHFFPKLVAMRSMNEMEIAMLHEWLERPPAIRQISAKKLLRSDARFLMEILLEIYPERFKTKWALYAMFHDAVNCFAYFLTFSDLSGPYIQQSGFWSQFPFRCYELLFDRELLQPQRDREFLEVVGLQIFKSQLSCYEDSNPSELYYKKLFQFFQRCQVTIPIEEFISILLKRKEKKRFVQLKPWLSVFVDQAKFDEIQQGMIELLKQTLIFPSKTWARLKNVKHFASIFGFVNTMQQRAEASNSEMLLFITQLSHQKCWYQPLSDEKFDFLRKMTWFSRRCSNIIRDNFHPIDHPKLWWLYFLQNYVKKCAQDCSCVNIARDVISNCDAQWDTCLLNLYQTNTILPYSEKALYNLKKNGYDLAKFDRPATRTIWGNTNLRMLDTWMRIHFRNTDLQQGQDWFKEFVKEFPDVNIYNGFELFKQLEVRHIDDRKEKRPASEAEQIGNYLFFPILTL